MKKLLFSIFLSFAFLGALIAADEPNVQVDSAKLADEKVIHKYKIGFSYGFSTPYSGTVDYAYVYGKSAMGTAEFDLTRKSFIYTELIFNSYKMDNGFASRDYFGDWFKIPDGTYESSKSKNPCKSYSYVLGYGLRTCPDHTKSSIRYGLGAIYNYNVLDEFTITTPTDTLTFPVKRSYSIGINLMVGFDLPMYDDVLGFSSTINISSGIIGTKNGFKMQYSSLTLFGLYYRF